MHYVGVDWGEEKHEICLMVEDGRALSEFSIKHDWKGFKKLAETLEKVKPFEVNVERSDGLLVEWMVGQQWEIYVTPGKAVASRRPRRSKDDRGDAYLLANLRRLRDEECRPLVIQSVTVEELRQLTRAYDQLLKQQLSTANQLRQVLRQYYPVVITVFSKVHQPLTLAFLQRFPSPQAANAASLDDLRAFCQHHHYRYASRLESIYRTLHEPMPSARVASGYEQHALALVAILQTLNQSLKQLHQRIQQVFNSHPEADWWRSLPGAGDLTAPRLLARLGDNRQQFPSSYALQATAGTVPVTRRSGKQQSVTFRWACSHPLRDAAIDFARNSLRHSGWAHSYYLAQLHRGHRPSRAYRALANRWLHIIWTLWQRRDVSDESLQLANRSRQGLMLPSVPHLAPA